MIIVNDLLHSGDLAEKTGGTPTVVALGTFDGLHRGHMDVIGRAGDYAREHGLRLAVLTFVNHPYTWINPCAVPQSLISPAEKIRRLKEAGVNLLVDIPFDRELALLSPKEFVRQLRKLHFRCLVCGANFPTVSAATAIRSCWPRAAGSTATMFWCGRFWNIAGSL